MQIVPYSDNLYDVWNTTVRHSKNATFLFDRNFMDYHKHRFCDCSLLFEDKRRVVALLPACWYENTCTVSSYAGLTYGGLLMSPDITYTQATECLSMALGYYRRDYGASKMVYKPVPYIYHKCPSGEDLYFLFRIHAMLTGRALSTVIYQPFRLPMRTLRLRGMKKAGKKELAIYQLEYSDIDLLENLWGILTYELACRHETRPVHSLEDIRLLWSRFPSQIHIWTVIDKVNRCYGGCVLFLTQQVAHLQYITSNEEGRCYGALDLLFGQLIENYSSYSYWDFGISTENEGRLLNEGLLFQKEGFGGRGVCYDTYEIDLMTIG